MLPNIFGEQTDKIVHCEVNGKETSIGKTRVLTKIRKIINLNCFNNPKVDYESKTIYSSNKPPIQYFVEIHVPKDLKPIIGDLFATVDDEVEQSTNILSDEGVDYFNGSQLIKIFQFLASYELIRFPDTMLFVSVNDISNFKTQTKTCENWSLNFQSLGKKYMVKKVLEQKKVSQRLGDMNILWPPFDVGFSDCSEKNPNGTGYLFKTDKNFIPVNLCSNESAVDYCKKNNCLAYYIDFINGGKMRVLSQFTPDINTNLQNDYKFRSSNI